jgi:hypothetical protein
MEKIKLSSIFLLSATLFFFLLQFSSAWAMCDCLYNTIQTYFIYLSSILGPGIALYFACRYERKGKSFLLSYCIFFVLSLLVMEVAKSTLVPVSNFLEKKFPTLSPSNLDIKNIQIPEINFVNPAVTATSTIQLATTSVRAMVVASSSELHMYHNEKYGFEIKYPDSLSSMGTGNDQDLIIDLGICETEGEMCGNGLSISVRVDTSLEEWYTITPKGGYYNNPLPRFKDTVINGLPTREILDARAPYSRSGSYCYVTAVYSKGRVFEICDSLNNGVSKSVINSFIIN